MRRENVYLWEKHLNIKVVKVRALKNYRLLLEFNNDGERRLFDVKPYLSKPAFIDLQNEVFFATAQVAFDTVCWGDEIDFCPEYLYNMSIPIPTHEDDLIAR